MSRLLKIAEEIDKTVREKPAVIPKAKPDGTPNPDSPEGRRAIIKDAAADVMDVFARANILKKIIDRANTAKDRKEFKEQLIELVDGARALQNRDVPNLSKTTINAVKMYEKSQGRDVQLEEKVAKLRR